MTFFRTTPDMLVGYAFDADELKHAQGIWRDCIDWFGQGALDPPTGQLGRLLTAGTTPAAAALITLAQSLVVLRVELTRKSVPVFEKKMRELFRVTKEAQFDEISAELTIGAAIAGLASPLALEPYVARDAPEHRKTRSPDYAIRTPDGDIAIEVTTLRVDALDRWDRLRRAVADRLGAQVGKRGGSVSFALKLPLAVKSVAAGDLLDQDAIQRIFAAEEGSIAIPLGEADATLSWKPLPVIRLGDPIPAEADAAVLVGQGEQPGPSWSWIFSMQARPEEIHDVLLSSLRQTLDDKLSQHRAHEPYLLIIRLGHPRIPREGVADLVNTRIWPNPMYKRLTGIGVFEPRDVHGKGKPATLHCWSNPGAVPQPTPSFNAVTSGAGTYHAPRKS